MSTDAHPLDFDDYRSFLKEWFERRAGRPSLRTVAGRMERSPSWLSRVLSGSRDLDPADVGRLASAMRLSAATALERLVLVSHGATDGVRREAERIHVGERLLRAASPLPDAAAAALNWPGVALLELLQGSAPADPAELGALLRPPVDADVVAASLYRLESSGLIVREARGWVPTDTQWLTEVAPEALGKQVRKQAKEALDRAMEAHESGPLPGKKVGVVTASVPLEQREALAALTNQYLQDVAALGVLPGSGGSREVVEVVVHVHPLSHVVAAGSADGADVS